MTQTRSLPKDNYSRPCDLDLRPTRMEISSGTVIYSVEQLRRLILKYKSSGADKSRRTTHAPRFTKVMLSQISSSTQDSKFHLTKMKFALWREGRRGKRRKSWLPLFSPFPMFSKAFLLFFLMIINNVEKANANKLFTNL